MIGMRRNKRKDKLRHIRQTKGRLELRLLRKEKKAIEKHIEK
jgi:hypothetical protein